MAGAAVRLTARFVTVDGYSLGILTVDSYEKTPSTILKLMSTILFLLYFSIHFILSEAATSINYDFKCNNK